MEEWERRRILGEWGVRGETVRERREREALERDLAGAPYRGTKVRLRPNPFGPAPDRYVASLGGPLPYMVRLREIAAAVEAHERELRRAWRRLSARYAADPDGFERRWRAVARRWSFGEVNDLIEDHNRWYPTEARLPMDPRTRDFALVNGEHYRREPLGAAWILRRFPPRLDLAAAHPAGATPA